MTTRRRRARAGAVEALYRIDLIGEDPATVIAETSERKRMSAEVAQYLRRLVEQTVGNRPAIDAELTRTLKRWKLDRVSVVDRAILRMACCEIMLFDDVPANVSINEAVEIAKSYSDDRAGQFVNGVLDAIARRAGRTEGMSGEDRHSV